MGSKLAWNTEGGDLNNRRATIQSELQSYRANWQFFLGDEGLMLSVLPYVDKGVIYRVFDPFHEWTDGGTFDNAFWQNHTPDEIISYVQVHLSHLLQYDNIVFSIGNNEPTTSGKTGAFLNWCIDLANKGKQAGIRFAIAEIATAKSVWHDEVQNGVWDEFIRTMDKHRGFHIFTIHEYTTGLLPACLLPDYPLNLDNFDALKKSNWQNAKINTETIEGNYHIGRGMLVSHVRAKQIGIQPIPFVVTECAFDWNADVMSTEERKQRIGNLRNAFKPPTNHDVLRGSTGHQRYHEWLMQKTGFQGDWNDYLFEQYRWLVNAYPSECEGLNIFSLNHDWDSPEGHDMSNARNDKFRQRVISEPLGSNIVTIPPFIEPFNPELFEATVRTQSGTWNMRKGMSATPSVEVIGELNTTARTMLVSKETAQGSTYSWYKFNENGNEGYFAYDDKLVIEYAQDEIPDDTPIDDSTLANLVENAVNARFEAYEARIAELEATIARLVEPVIVDVPDVSYSVPRFALSMLGSMYAGLERVNKVQKDFIQGSLTEPTLTASQIADIGFKASASSSELFDDRGNISITNTDEDTILDIMLNGDDDETDNDFKIAS